MKKDKLIWKLLLIVGAIPFIFVLSYGGYSFINGFSFLCFYSECVDYGLDAFINSIFLCSFIIWPTYIIGIILIGISTIKLWKSRNIKIEKKQKDNII